MRPVLIITAVPREAALLEQSLTGPTRHDHQAFPYVTGMLGMLSVAICVGGVGKINAGAASAAMIERLAPALVINTGCAGAFPGSGLVLGDLAVATDEVLGDEGVVTSTGWLDLCDMRMPTLIMGDQRYYNDIPLSPLHVQQALQLAERSGTALVSGRFVTVSTCSGSEEQGVRLSSRFTVICENMEGAAIAQVCLRYGVACLEIRGISNMVEERNLAAWNIPAAVEAAQAFVLKYLQWLELRKQ